MKRTVVLSCFAGHGIALLMIVLVFGIAAVPTPTPPSSAQAVPDSSTWSSSLGTADTMVTSSSIPSQNSSVTQENDPPAIINNKNVTETEIVITEARHGKSLHHHNQQHDLIVKNDSDSGGATTSDPTDSNFSVKLAQDGDHIVQHIEGGDAPPKNDTDEKSSKAQELQEAHLLGVSTTPAPSPRDKMIQRIFGGECDFAHWTRCSRLKFWGGDYLVPDKNNPGQFIVKHHKIRCVESPGYTLCLRNGWTVARCHMLCMSACNVEFRMNFEKLVSHEGDCKNPLMIGG